MDLKYFPTLVFICLAIMAQIPSSTESTEHQSLQSSKMSSFRDCLTEFGVPTEAIVPQNSSGYSPLNDQQWNTRLPKIYPLAYFLPDSTGQVQAAVRCGQKLSIPLIPKSGGHSYESYSFGNSESIVVDLCKMNSVSVNAVDETAVIGAGALLGEIAIALWENGRFGIPMGQSMTVGVGGQTLGGGIGVFSNLYGLTLDSVLEMMMVDAAGDAHKVSATENSDLFWALRGVGSGYIGIVTSFKFKLFRASETKVTVVRLTHDMKSGTHELLVSWQKWMNWCERVDPTVHSYMTFAGDKISTRAVHIQDPKKPGNSDDFLAAIAEIFPPATQKAVYFPSYVEILTEFFVATLTNTTLGDVDWTNLRNLTMPPRYLKAKSFFVDQIFDPGSLLRQVSDWIVGRSGRLANNTMLFFTNEGGAIHAPLPESCSYVHRKSLYSIMVRIQIMGVPSESEVGEARAWLDEFGLVSKFMDNGETYQNYPDNELEDNFRRYYGSNLERLVEIKKKWDWGNYFRNPESLLVA